MGEDTSGEEPGRRRDDSSDLIEREALYRSAFEHAPIGIALLSPEGRWLQVNASVCRIVGYSEDELLQITFQDITHPEDLDADLDYVREMLAGTITEYKMEKRYFHKKGHVIWIELSVFLVRDAEGRPKYFISQFNDISERKRMELELRQREALLQKLTDDAPVMLWMADIDRQCSYFNKTALEFTGRSLKDELGLKWLERVHPKDREPCRQNYDTGCASLRPFKSIYRLRRHDGEYRYMEDLGNPRFDSSGQLTGFIGICTDITERLNSETDLRNALEVARDADLAKSTFLATMSHEIRTPLHSIIGFTHLILDSELNEQHRNLVSPILSGGEMLLAVINDILDYSKIEAGHVELERVEFSLPKCVKEVGALFSAKASEKSLEFLYVVESSVPELVIGDINRLRQVLSNLLSNAIKFTSEGKVTLTVSSAGSNRGVHQIHFEIRDSGIGFAADKMPQLFEPFRQLDSSTTRTFGGTGLGLAICKRLIDAMNGSLTAESSPGRGSTFHLRLPLPVSVQAENRPAKHPITVLHTQTLRPISPLSPRAQALRILVAEDNETNQQLISQLLKRMGLQSPDLVNHGAAAIDAISRKQYDVVLMDCQMPVMDGYEATQKIRQTAAGQQLIIVALTAAALAGDREKALQSGMDDYLTKPIRAEVFAQLLEQIAQGIPT